MRPQPAGIQAIACLLVIMLATACGAPRPAQSAGPSGARPAESPLPTLIEFYSDT